MPSLITYTSRFPFVVPEYQPSGIFPARHAESHRPVDERAVSLVDVGAIGESAVGDEYVEIPVVVIVTECPGAADGLIFDAASGGDVDEGALGVVAPQYAQAVDVDDEYVQISVFLEITDTQADCRSPIAQAGESVDCFADV